MDLSGRQKVYRSRVWRILFPVIWLLVLFLRGDAARAGEETVIRDGVYAGTVPLGGLTREEAIAAVEQYVAGLMDETMILLCAEQQTVEVKLKDLNVFWSNPEMIDRAVDYGNRGNVIARYKARKDLSREPKIFSIQFSADYGDVRGYLKEHCSIYDRPVVDARLRRENNQFFVEEGRSGCFLDVDRSVTTILQTLSLGLAGDREIVTMHYRWEKPREDSEDLWLVKDVLGSFQTSFGESGGARCANIENGCALINGTTLYPGEEFSVYEAVSPFTEENGYQMAGSFLEGRVVDSLGGGICQVSTTLYNAVLASELQVTERHPHSMVVSYVDLSRDAAISESAGKDLRFVNSSDYPVYIEGYTEEKQICFRIYGVEERPENRSVSFETEILQTVLPGEDKLMADDTRTLGEIEVAGAVSGYQTRLWKVIREDGRETSREVINESSYKMRPRTTMVGTDTENQEWKTQIQAAIRSGNRQQVEAALAEMTGGPNG